MAEVKKTFKKVGRQIWELFKGSVPSGLMFACAGAVLVILTLKGEITELKWDATKITWTAVCIVVATVYAALMSYLNGGNAYEMLVTGNVKRMSEDSMEGGYKMSKYVPAKEYRVWKGFAIGGFMAIIPLVSGLIFGAKQGAIDGMLVEIMTKTESSSSLGAGFGILIILILFLSGWTILPIFITNAVAVTTGGAMISYYFSCLFALLPVVVSGAMYIAGAYGRRAKTVRQQEVEDKIAQAQANKEKKINYGGLPGTKPKKRR